MWTNRWELYLNTEDGTGKCLTLYRQGYISCKERTLGLSGTQPWGIPAWGKLNSFSTEKKSSVANRTGI